MSSSTIKKLVIGIAALVVIGIIVALCFRPGADLPAVVKIDTSNQPTLGEPNAKVKIVAFEDLKCFNCKRFSLNVFPTIKKQYVDKGIANYTMINLAFIPGSIPAANAAHCLYNQNKDFFFPFVDYVYHHQPDETQDWATIPRLMEFASHIKGVDQKALSECIFEGRYTAFIENNLSIAQQAMTGDVISTPMVYVNGRVVKPLTVKRMAELIEAAQED